METIPSTYRITKECLYMNDRTIVKASDIDILYNFLRLKTGVLQLCTITPFLFIICLDYISINISLKTIDKNTISIYPKGQISSRVE